jgi:hypothetical protein
MLVFNIIIKSNIASDKYYCILYDEYYNSNVETLIEDNTICSHQLGSSLHILTSVWNGAIKNAVRETWLFRH